MTTLRHFIRHAEVYGVDGVYEVAARELPASALGGLCATLAALDPSWTDHPPTSRNTKAVCRRCREVFETARSDARYCSHACRQAAYRARST